MTRLPRVMIAAAHKSSGKTVVTTGLTAALTVAGDRVAPFKKGPDYIDPMWLAEAAGRPCYNLDFNAMAQEEIAALVQSRSAGADLTLIEANKGLFDGVALDGADSNAALAAHLGTPVVLVIDTRGMTRGIAPLLLGYQAFDPGISIAGVILNKTGGSRHEGKLRQAVEAYTDVAVLGAIGAAEGLDISERHLGLTTPGETDGLRALIARLAQAVGAGVALDRVREIAATAPAWEPVPEPAVTGTPGQGLRIGIARDEAFGFYYADDLDAFRVLGAELVPIDMIRDPGLPPLDGLFIGGGFPEMRMQALAANAAMRVAVREALAAGLPCYAECGGLMYLCRSIAWKGETVPMAGFLDADVVMHSRPQGRGYVAFEPLAAHPWAMPEAALKAHEFHYARLENVAEPVFARRITRGHGIDGAHDGIVKGNTLAGFVHLRNSERTPWVGAFLDFVRRCRADGAGQGAAVRSA